VEDVFFASDGPAIFIGFLKTMAVVNVDIVRSLPHVVA
jgi:hypothetical protein